MEQTRRELLEKMLADADLEIAQKEQRRAELRMEIETITQELKPMRKERTAIGVAVGKKRTRKAKVDAPKPHRTTKRVKLAEQAAPAEADK